MCDLTHGACGLTGLCFVPMEWMLQVVDEVDDAVCAAKHRWLGFSTEYVSLRGIALMIGTIALAYSMGLGVAS